MAENAQQSVNEAVGDALRFSRGNMRFILPTALIAAAVLTVLAALRLSVLPLAGILTLLSAVVQAGVYAALLRAALNGPDAVRANLVNDTGRVLASMVIIGLFLSIVFIVALMPGIMVLAAGPLAPYSDELQAVGNDQDAAMEIMTRFMQDNPAPLLIFMTVYMALWLLLTSRLYLAAPASVERGRILTLETWRWTKGSMLRIALGRLMLLGPAYVLVMVVALLAGRMIGVDIFAPAQTAPNMFVFLIYAALLSILNVSLYSALEAGLSTAFYKRLAPPSA